MSIYTKTGLYQLQLPIVKVHENTRKCRLSTWNTRKCRLSLVNSDIKGFIFHLPKTQRLCPSKSQSSRIQQISAWPIPEPFYWLFPRPISRSRIHLPLFYWYVNDQSIWTQVLNLFTLSAMFGWNHKSGSPVAK